MSSSRFQWFPVTARTLGFVFHPMGLFLSLWHVWYSRASSKGQQFMVSFPRPLLGFSQSVEEKDHAHLVSDIIINLFVTNHDNDESVASIVGYDCTRVWQTDCLPYNLESLQDICKIRVAVLKKLVPCRMLNMAAEYKFIFPIVWTSSRGSPMC